MKRLLAAIVSLLLLFSLFGCKDEEQQLSTDEELIAAAQSLLTNGDLIASELFSIGGLTADVPEDVDPATLSDPYFLTNDTRFASVEDIKKAMLLFYTEEYAAATFFSQLDGDMPRYKDDGGLKVNTAYRGKTPNYVWDFSSARVVQNTDISAVISVKTTCDDSSIGTCEVVLLKNAAGQWRVSDPARRTSASVTEGAYVTPTELEAGAVE